MKIATHGRWLWTRTIGSTLVGQALDSAVFISLAFAGTIPAGALASAIVTQWLVKSGYEALATPLTYLTVGFLKRAEGIDAYDYGVRFNPFRITGLTRTTLHVAAEAHDRQADSGRNRHRSPGGTVPSRTARGPTGVSKVRLKDNIDWTFGGAGYRHAWMHKNGGLFFGMGRGERPGRRRRAGHRQRRRRRHAWRLLRARRPSDLRIDQERRRRADLVREVVE